MDDKRDILFQKMGQTWYAIAEIEGEVLYTALPPGVDPRKKNMEFYEVLENCIEESSVLNEVIKNRKKAA